MLSWQNSKPKLTVCRLNYKKEEEERRKNAEIKAELIKKDLGSEKKETSFW